MADPTPEPARSAPLEYLKGLFERGSLEAAPAEWVSRAIVIVVVVGLAVAANYIARTFLLRGIRALVARTRMKWDDKLVEAHVFDRLSQIAPALVLHSCAELMFAGLPAWVIFVERLSLAYMVVVGVRVVSAILDALVEVYRGFDVAKNRPMKGFAQVVQIVAWIVGIVLILGILMDQSPWAFLSGLGAMTAILLLVFKDSILGLVAGVQLAANDMVRLGDWVEMPKYGADGDVIDISLTTIKVQNWNKTISTIPTYAFIADSFKNWRGMDESGGRRIKRSLAIDMNTVKFCDKRRLQRLRKLVLLREYIDERETEIEAYNAEHDFDASVRANGRRLTNLGTFRKYVEAYVRSHPLISDEMTMLVRHLQPTSEGLPIEIYCFSTDKAWANYEAIQADIFDHLLAALPEFGLRVYQRPSGVDMREGLNAVAKA